MYYIRQPFITFVRGAYKFLYVVFMIIGITVSAIVTVPILFHPRWWNLFASFLKWTNKLDDKIAPKLGIKHNPHEELVHDRADPQMDESLWSTGLVRKTPVGAESRPVQQSIAGWHEYYPDTDFD